MATKRTKKTLGRAAVAITIVAVVGVGLLGYNAASGAGKNPDHYRTVTAAAGTVTQTIALSGVVHHVTQDSVSFPTSGMVTAVNVKAGDTVTAGQTLASIDTRPLQDAVLAANATYTAAISQYETDQQTYSSSSSSSSTTKAATASTSHQTTTGTASSASPSGSGSPSGGPGGGGLDPAAAVKAATDALAALQIGVKSVETALPAFVSQCIPLIPTTTAAPTATVTKTVTATATVTQTVTVTAVPSGSVSGAALRAAVASSGSTATTTASGTATSSSSATASASSGVTAACQAAIDTLTAAQSTLPEQMTAANVTLTAAVKALTAQAAALQQEAAALQKQQQAAQAAAAAAQAAAARQQASSLTSSNSALQAAAAAGLSRSGGGTVTAATLITDQAAIQTAGIALAQAKDQLAQATLTSPIAGKVASMPFVVGQQASATATAVIIGSGAIEVTVAVPLASRPLIATGEAAQVVSVVGGTTLEGTISRISLLPTTTGFSLAGGAGAAAAGGSSSTTSTTTYATVITVPTGGDALPEGSRVQTTITTKTVDAAVVVPASAVTPLSSGSGTVQVVTNGVVETKRVVTGAVGSSEIQIISGLNAGEIVVIADVTKPIAGASIAASRATQRFGGGNVPAGEAGATGGNAGAGGTGGAEPPAGGAPPS